MKQFLTLSLLCCAFAMTAQNIITVSNDATFDADYSSISAAIANAGPNDLIYVHGTEDRYGNLTITKKVHLIGTGYFLEENNILQTTSPNAALLSSVTFSNGSNGSIIEGFETSSIFLNDDNITVRRNRVLFSNSRIEVSADDCNIINNYFTFVQDGNSVAVDNLQIIGNYISSGVYFDDLDDNVIVLNNVLGNGSSSSGVGSVSGVYARNNIFTSPGSYSNSTLEFNIFRNSNPPLGTGNVGSVDMSTVFVDSSIDTDSDLQLINDPSNPAVINCDGGCGPSFGNFPYVLSGIPNIPQVYQLSVSDQPDNNGNIQVSLNARKN